MNLQTHQLPPMYPWTVTAVGSGQPKPSRHLLALTHEMKAEETIPVIAIALSNLVYLFPSPCSSPTHQENSFYELQLHIPHLSSYDCIPREDYCNLEGEIDSRIHSYPKIIDIPHQKKILTWQAAAPWMGTTCSPVQTTQ